MTNKELITKLQTLKQIKPSQDWASSVKMSMFEAPVQVSKPGFGQNWQAFLSLFTQRKLAYAFAIFLFVFLGGVSFIRYGLPQNGNANLAVSDSVAQVALQNNVKDFRVKSENLVAALQNNSPSTPSAIKEVKDAAKTLADTIEKNPKLAKSIALDVNNSKTVLDIPGGSQDSDLKTAINTPYKALVEQLIKDEKEATLTADQQMVLDSVVKLHEQGNDSDALVNLVLLIKSTDSK